MSTEVILRLRVFIPFAMAFFLTDLYRVVNTIVAPDLVTDIGLSPSALGFLSATIFISFASFQLPIGVLVDHFGSRRTVACLLVFATFGAILFSRAHCAFELGIGRAIIGLGVSSSLMAAFAAYAQWFPLRRLPMINGFHMAVGGLGALTATAPVEAALNIMDWRNVFLILAVITLAVSLGVLFIVPEKGRKRTGLTIISQVRGIHTVYTSREFWLIAPWAVMGNGFFLAVQTLWAGPWLRDVCGLDRMGVAYVLFLFVISMICGFIFLGIFAERLDKVGIKLRTVAYIGMCLFVIVQVGVLSGLKSITLLLWPLFGFFGSTSILAYAALTQQFPVMFAGRVNTGLNVLVFSAAFVMQWGIGKILDLWTATSDGGYAQEAYRIAFGLILVLEVCALLFPIILKGNFFQRAEASTIEKNLTSNDHLKK